MKFTPSSRKNPCPICGRTKDGDCRVLENKFVLCHTPQVDAKEGRYHQKKPFIYCGWSDDAQGFGTWKPKELDDSSQKDQRQTTKEPLLWTYRCWDGEEFPVQRKRVDREGQDKWVGWAAKFPDGRRQSEIAPFQWHDSIQRCLDGELLFVVKGELKAEQMVAAGFPCISVLDVTERLVAGLRQLQSQVVLAPDCDLADLHHWYQELANQLPDARHLMPPLKGMNWSEPPKDGGLGVEDWLQRSKPDVEAILNAIVADRWDSTGSDAPSDDLFELGYSDLLDKGIEAIRAANLDLEMLVRSEFKNRFRISDDRINTDLFKRLGEGKVAKVKPKHDCVDLSKIESLHYIQDGWSQEGDLGLVYGTYGTGKTTLGIWKAYNGAQGKTILDRSKTCTPYKSLIIATDSGLGPLNRAFENLGLDPETDPILKAGHPDQMIHVWGHDPTQGHGSWICDIRGIIKLEQYIAKHNIKYVLIDSAKSVSSAAGWSYTSNEAVKALLTYIREAISFPLGCFIEFISHDGTIKGSHSGAKAWAEEPSMVCSLDVKKDEDSGLKTVECTFRKDRAAPEGQGERIISYTLDDCELKLCDNIEVVGNCADAILEVLWTAYQNGVESVTKKDLIDEVFARFKKTTKTVENSMPDLMKKGNQRMVRPRRGRYALSPSEIQRRASSPNRDLYKKGGEIGKSIGMTEESDSPLPVFSSGDRGKLENQNPRKPPSGETQGGYENSALDSDLTLSPPFCDGPIEETVNFADVPLPVLNGHTAAFWEVVDADPAALPSQIANRFKVATGRTISGAQAKALRDCGRQVDLNLDPDDLGF
jgi:hypothetical protein